MAARTQLSIRDRFNQPRVAARINELLTAMDQLVVDGDAGVPQALSGAGAINLTTAVTYFTSTGGAQALTLANGSVVGQEKYVVHVVDGGSGVITHNGTTINLANSVAAVTLTNKGESVGLKWNGTAWVVILASPAGILS